MNNRNFDEMVERYKREMVNCSRRCCPAPQQKTAEVQREQSRAESEENARQGGSESENETPEEGCFAVQPQEENAKAKPSTAGDDMLGTLAAGCAGGGEGSAACAELNDFLKKNCEKGTMSVNVFAWNTPFGISSARVIVLVPLKSGNVIIYNGVTDSNGKTEEFQLPAPPGSVSLAQNDTSTAAYAGYTVIVEHPDYRRAMFTNVPVFEGIESVQPVSLFNAGDVAPEDGAVTEIPEPEL